MIQDKKSLSFLKIRHCFAKHCPNCHRGADAFISYSSFHKILYLCPLNIGSSSLKMSTVILLSVIHFTRALLMEGLPKDVKSDLRRDADAHWNLILPQII